MTSRHHLVRINSLRHWLVFSLMAISWAAAVVLRGGVTARQWEWSALGISVAALLAILQPRGWGRAPRERFGGVLLTLLLAWMMLQIAPLPPQIMDRVAPQRAADLAAARSAAAGGEVKAARIPNGWTPLSVAPAATIERLLDVLPAMAALIAAREMGWWWRARFWIPLAPIVGMAWLESLAGLLQFSSARVSGTGAVAANPAMATGTYVYHNHFAGLLELALPLAVMGVVREWRRGRWQRELSLAAALRAAALLGVAACLLLGILASLSRMGFASLLAAAMLTALAVSIPRGGVSKTRRGLGRWAWSIPAAAALAIALLLPPKELMARFAELDLPQDSRARMWSDTTRLVRESAWLGVGVGAFEQGLYRYKTSMPLNRVDFAHNDYLQIVVEMGWVGAALAGAVAVWVFAKAGAIVLWLPASSNWEFAVGLLAALLTLAVHSFADFNLYLPANALALAWLAGLAVSPGLKGR